MESARLARVLSHIDAYNSQDPNVEMVEDVEQPRELLYGARLTQWVLKLNPEASELLRIAARGQHVGRWTIPRQSYPMNRGGYLRWREDLKKFHAATVAGFMEKEGYTAEEAERVRAIILKKNLGTDPDVQTIEDALCLIFLETQFEELESKTPEAKMIDIIRKTWKKMSPQAQQAAVALPLPERETSLIKKALPPH